MRLMASRPQRLHGFAENKKGAAAGLLTIVLDGDIEARLPGRFCLKPTTAAMAA
jgi:hypothetical protein